MTVKRAFAALILSAITAALVALPAAPASAATSPKPPGCGTPTTPQCEAS